MKRHINRRKFAKFGITLTALIAMSGAGAQSADSVRMIVPFAPGGGTDTVARLVGNALEPIVGVPVVIENRAGASGTIGINTATRMPANGKNLVLGQADNMAVAPLLLKGVNYDPVKDLKPVAHVADIPILIATATSEPYQSLNDVIEAGKKDSQLLTFASAGVGTTPHLSGELFAQSAGIEMQHISYQGSSPALTDVLAGRVTLIATSISLAVPYIESGKLRPLAVTSATRSVALPDVPTVSEASDIKDFSIGTWYGIFAPAETSDEAIQELNAQINQALEQPKLKAFLEDQEGGHIRKTTSQELGNLLRDDIPRWQKIIDDADIQL